MTIELGDRGSLVEVGPPVNRIPRLPAVQETHDGPLVPPQHVEDMGWRLAGAREDQVLSVEPNVDAGGPGSI
jgi:hypothetical protein